MLKWERERERKRKYLEKVGPENEETSSPCNELEIFRFSSTWRSSLRDSYRADLLWQTSRNVEKKGKEEEKLNDKKNEEDEVEEYGITF